MTSIYGSDQPRHVEAILDAQKTRQILDIRVLNLEGASFACRIQDKHSFIFLLTASTADSSLGPKTPSRALTTEHFETTSDHRQNLMQEAV